MPGDTQALTTFALYAIMENPDKAPLSARLAMAQDQFGAMFAAGEMDALPDDTRCILHGLRMFMFEASEAARELEMRHVPPRPAPRVPGWVIGVGVALMALSGVAGALGVVVARGIGG